jgi:hypothetical protein
MFMQRFRNLGLIETNENHFLSMKRNISQNPPLLGNALGKPGADWRDVLKL